MEESSKELLRKEPEQKAEQINLAVERTELALERTQLSWIRTTLGLIASGIALDKGMDAIHNARLLSGNALFNSSHAIGILLSATGTVLLLFVTLFYIQRSRSLASMRGVRPKRIPPGAAASILIILLGAVISILLLVS